MLPNDPRILELTGYILRRQGKYEEGLRELEQAVALDHCGVDLISDALPFGRLRYRKSF